MAKWALILVVLASVLWSGWWVVGARGVEAAATQGLSQIEAQGWRVERADLSVAGFPNRFDVTLTEPRVTTPTGWTLAGDIFRAFALSYRPNHLIAVAPPEMALTHPLFGQIDIAAEDLRASLIVTASTTPLLDRATIAAEALRLTDEGGMITLDRGQIATRQAAGPTVHDLAINLGILAGPRMGRQIDRVDVDATLTFDRALGAGDPARLDRLSIRSATLVSGDSQGTLSGELSITSDGTPRGNFALRLTDWEPLLADAIAAGLIPDGQASLIAAGLSGLTNEDGEATVPIALDSGSLLVLGLPVATLPRLPVPGR